MKIIRVLVTLMISTAAPVLACSFDTGVRTFSPSIKSFEPIYDENGYVSLPKPLASAKIVKRGTATAGSSCDDAGIVSVQVSIPKGHAFKLRDVGFYFRVINGNDVLGIFPKHPLVGRITGNKMQFSFVWLDGAPANQAPLDLLVEVIPVNKGLELGPSAQFRLK